MSLPWPALGSLLSAALSVYFVRYLWPHRDDRSAQLFVGLLACETLWAASYGLGLLVFDPTLRWLFEIPMWLGINFIGVFFLAFALEYTGRGDLVRSPFMAALVVLQVVHTLVVATNPVHHIAWSNYRIVPAFGSATVLYTHEAWLFVNLAGVLLMVAAAVFLLLDTFARYGPLYSDQTVAVALSTVMPTLTIGIWVLGLSPTPQLNLTALVFPVHLGFDMYAFFRRDMFEMTPAVRRASERAVLDDIGSAVLVVDQDRRVVNLNENASDILGVPREEVLGRALDDYVDVTLDADEQTVSTARGGERREYTVTTSPVEDTTGERVGYTVALQDITAAKRREQRLGVLNRVLRHNLRNDLNVVEGYVEVAAARTDDDAVAEALETAHDRTLALIALGEKARTIDEAMEAGMGGDGAGSADGASGSGDAAASPDPVAVGELLDGVVTDLASSDGPRQVAVGDPNRVEVSVPEELRVRSNRELLESVFRNLVENGLEHADETTVAVRFVGTDDGSALFEIEDDGPGIPDHELAVLEKGQETALEHGSGLGLWLVEWGVTSLGGEVEFETGEDGTTVRLAVPGVVDGAGAAQEERPDEADADATPRRP